ncbi:DUF2069 domain-containing protein [Halopseudomonas salegens]|uniref:Uncharacterized membrane protein n=1 Tax=Halopseudomonas salegens TaxID=1434072 RepID=A0A1H2G2B0_9GAMM|nr:DUF2069 domain-containing protein [Halopseudomonas salegens]SDU13759.1 Uncharacterized membrane protein [Halopseudomonas salegens]
MRRNKPLPSLDYLLPRARGARLLAALGYYGLAITLAIYNALFANLHGANPNVIIGVLLFPLLIFLPGIITGNPRVHAWLCFAINLYFIYGVLLCFQPGNGLYGALVVFFSSLCFCASVVYVRWSFQAKRVQAGDKY